MGGHHLEQLILNIESSLQEGTRERAEVIRRGRLISLCRAAMLAAAASSLAVFWIGSDNVLSKTLLNLALFGMVAWLIERQSPTPDEIVREEIARRTRRLLRCW